MASSRKQDERLQCENHGVTSIFMYVKTIHGEMHVLQNLREIS